MNPAGRPGVRVGLNRSPNPVPAMIPLDGSQGEGGGQILRSALTLAALTGTPFKLTNIRAGRAKPGLAAQHLTCVKAAARICRADYKGAAIGSSTLDFQPGEVAAGDYAFTIGTAGATALVLQTVVLPLALRAAGPSTVTVTGGTHAAHAPAFEYLAQTWGGYLTRMGLDVEFTLVTPGFHPRGGGEVRAVIRPCTGVKSLTLLDPVAVTAAGGFSAAASLPAEVADRQAARLAARLKAAGVESHIPTLAWENGPGSVAGVVFRQPPVPAVFTALGERGKPAERVADEAADLALAFKASGAAVDPHGADQIVLPLAFAAGPSAYRASAVTQHLLTNLDIVGRFVPRGLTCEREAGGTAVVRVGPGPV